MKILKIERGNQCKYFRYDFWNMNKFKCTHPKAKRKNGHSRIINRRLALSGRFPKFCPLENYKEIVI